MPGPALHELGHTLNPCPIGFPARLLDHHLLCDHPVAFCDFAIVLSDASGVRCHPPNLRLRSLGRLFHAPTVLQARVRVPLLLAEISDLSHDVPKNNGIPVRKQVNRLCYVLTQR